MTSERELMHGLCQEEPDRHGGTCGQVDTVGLQETTQRVDGGEMGDAGGCSELVLPDFAQVHHPGPRTGDGHAHNGDRRGREHRRRCWGA